MEIAGQLYTKGLGNYLNLLDAQRTLYLSQNEVVKSDLAVTLNLIAIYKALGGGWQLTPDVFTGRSLVAPTVCEVPSSGSAQLTMALRVDGPDDGGHVPVSTLDGARQEHD